MTQRLGEAWSFSANVLFAFAGQGAQHTDLGDRFQYNAALSYRVIGATAPSTVTRASVPVAYTHAGHDHSPAARGRPAPEHEHLHLEVPQMPQLAVDAVLELNGEWHDKQTVRTIEGNAVKDERDRNSGGNVVYLSPGARVSYGALSGFVSVGVPIVNHMNGLQAKAGNRVVSGFAFAF